MFKNGRPKALLILDIASMDLIYGPEEQRELAALANIFAPPQSGESIKDNLALLADVEVIFSGWGAPVMDEAFLAAAPNLKAVFYGGGSVRPCTTQAFWRRNIAITSAAEANAIPVAEFTQSMIVLSLKSVWSFAALTRQSRGWEADGHPRHVAGSYDSTAGFISLGRIARKTLELLNPFEINRLVYSVPAPTDDEVRQFRFERCGLDDLFRRSDVVSVHAPSLPSTAGMIRGSHFEMMKQGATFINTARGAVVNEEEMIEALSRRPDITALLDVTHPEPPAPDSPLLTLPNVVLTPHIAGSMGRECQRLGRFMLEEFRRYLAGEPLKWQITENAAEMIA